MNKTKLFVTIFLASIIIGNPFVAVKLANKDKNIEISNVETNIDTNTEAEQNVNESQEQKYTIQKIKADKHILLILE